ncbi:MAG TPA: 3-dehydroquinate synthase, partial [Pirellulales bacterium]|nr:3-dehydroquinate synthase [Pirellulales bacterium]
MTSVSQKTSIDAKTVRVNLAERAYDIVIGAGNLGHVGHFVARLGLRRAAIITDVRVEKPHGVAVAGSLSGAGVQVDVLVVDEGENSKSIAVADMLWQKLLKLGADRKTAIVAVGGGVVGDLAGFVAATYARGLPFVQVPTTLLAQVDSSVGGKTGVNLPGAKNMVGVVWQPRGVFIDVQTLKTQRDRDYRAGLAEVVKYGVILDADFFTLLEKEVPALLGRRHRTLETIVARSCELKAHVVEHDEREETGLRAVLNYGHTFCHALEAVTGYGKLLHGEAVSIGMMCAARLAQRLGRVDEAFVARQRALLLALGLPVVLPSVDRE